MNGYYQEQGRDVFHPDRRQRGQLFAGSDRRKMPEILVTSEQYAHLRDCLIRREESRAKLSTSVRRLRHSLVGVSAVFLLVFFSATKTSITLTIAQMSLTVPLSSIAAVVPFILAYMIVYTCEQARTKMRLGHECQILDMELRRFGAETSYSVLGRFVTDCRSDTGRWEQLMAPRLNHMMYGLRDTFFVGTVMFAMIWAVVLAGKAYLIAFAKQPHASFGFVSYLVVAVVTAIASPIVYRALERQKSKALNIYLQESERARLSTRESTGGAHVGRPAS